MNWKHAALASMLWLAAASATNAQPDARCTREALNVTGTPVTVSYCVVGSSRSADGREAVVAVQETYSSPRVSFSQASSLAFLAGDDPSRVIEDVSLARLGMSGTLHLTLMMRAGRIRIEAAMLTPGAIVVK